MVCCSRCSSPHHDECWRFTGRCAIYACSSEQFTTAAGVIDDAAFSVEDTPDATPRPATHTRHVPVVIDDRLPDTEVALGKRDAFRRWLRDLLDDGIGVPRLWTSAPLVQRRMLLPEPEHEEQGRIGTGWVVMTLLAVLPLILLLVLLRELSAWVVFEVVSYLGLIGGLYVFSGTQKERELIVDARQFVLLASSRPFLGTRRRQLADLRGIAAVALLVGRDTSSGCEPGVVLLDYEKRPIAIPGLELPARRHGNPVDDDVKRARDTARFLGLSFAGAVDSSGRRRRLPAPGS